MLKHGCNNRKYLRVHHVHGFLREEVGEIEMVEFPVKVNRCDVMSEEQGEADDPDRGYVPPRLQALLENCEASTSFSEFLDIGRSVDEKEPG